MISSPTDSGSVPVEQSGWWVERYKSYICAALGLVELLCGIITLISLSPLCILAGIAQVLSSIIVLSVEAPTFVSQLRFAAPVGMFFDGKPNWMKGAVYGVAAIVPLLFTCFGVFLILGFIVGLAIAAVYAAIILGPKASRDDMKYAASGAAQPYSPTSP